MACRHRPPPPSAGRRSERRPGCVHRVADALGAPPLTTLGAPLKPPRIEQPARRGARRAHHTQSGMILPAPIHHARGRGGPPPPATTRQSPTAPHGGGGRRKDGWGPGGGGYLGFPPSPRGGERRKQRQGIRWYHSFFCRYNRI
jgi:hypothetical protein